MKISVCNPLHRTPLALIIDDSCPVINLGSYWIEQRAAWRAQNQPDIAAGKWEGELARVASVPRTIPAAFADKWGVWCGEAGVKGKFSMIPFPAGAGRIDQEIKGFPRSELENWLRVARETIAPNFDLTPEMLTHTHVVDLKSGALTSEWEQVEWVNPPVELLAEYIATAMQWLKNAGIEAQGTTSPGAFAKEQEAAYARAVLDASLEVFGNARPFYFLWLKNDEWPDVPIWYPEKERGIAIASIVSCAGDWFGGWTGYPDPDDAANADLFITSDGQGGRLPPVLARELPCVLVGHWPGFYMGGQETGFAVLREVKRRMDDYDPDKTRTLWMKTSEIGHYEMARQLSVISLDTSETVTEEETVRISTRFPTARFTLRVDARLRCVRIEGNDLREVQSKRDFTSGTFWIEGQHTFLAFDLSAGETQVQCWKA